MCPVEFPVGSDVICVHQWWRKHGAIRLHKGRSSLKAKERVMRLVTRGRASGVSAEREGKLRPYIRNSRSQGTRRGSS
jgi:hypothetical protein